MAEKTIPIQVKFQPDLLAAIDAQRGDVPRVVFIRRAVERTLDAKPTEGAKRK